MAFPGYGAAPGGVAQDPLYGYFSAVAGQPMCLLPPAFSLETCRLMISMLDRDRSNSLGFAEFKDLWQVLNGWKMTFASYDRDRSGTVEGQELQHAVAAMGYNLSPQAMNIIMKRFSSQGRITFDDFVSCCVKLRALTDQFQRRDTTRTGSASFQYDDFIQVTMAI
ncbi:hypothetical protein FQN60_017427 [Etheostoma spectabile]|uniref:EF-hand domain-containing protein n=1 Tax=Etheostoma spectabile TaxID=54343 RepID=A0A5J5DFG0_9PERO|nr:hypothetical protein FQN60_018805 [Etheostoma spectabile]KAA8592053.1 hypothetical protein FQN60_017427 [Etheostoma spectabile]